VLVAAGTVQKQKRSLRSAGNEFVNKVRLRPHSLVGTLIGGRNSFDLRMRGFHPWRNAEMRAELFDCFIHGSEIKIDALDSWLSFRQAANREPPPLACASFFARVARSNSSPFV
jgi:hypothetical protein